jgi:hypothetical protein
MDVDELAGLATMALVQRLGSGGADPLVTLVSRRLQFSFIGKRALADLRTDPTGAWPRELTTSVIADELSRGPVFERALAETLGPFRQTATETAPRRLRALLSRWAWWSARSRESGPANRDRST